MGHSGACRVRPFSRSAAPALMTGSSAWTPRQEQPRTRQPTRTGRALRGVSRIQRGRPAPAHRHFGSATSRTRVRDATRREDRCEPPQGFGSSPTAPARRSRQPGAPHRTNDVDGDKRRRTLEGAEAPLLTEGSPNDGLRLAATSRPSPPGVQRHHNLDESGQRRCRNVGVDNLEAAPGSERLDCTGPVSAVTAVFSRVHFARDDRLREHLQNRLRAKDSPKQISQHLVFCSPKIRACG